MSHNFFSGKVADGIASNQGHFTGGIRINGDPDVLGYDKEVIKNGHIQLSDRPGFGIELNEELIRGKYLIEGETWWS